MKTEIRDVTPKIAKEMLRRNSNNRKLTKNHINFLANEMKEGRWLFDGQPIRLTSSGNLLDGQHRLNAVVESGKTQKFLIISGIEAEAFRVMDTGKNRDASDTFSIEGIENSIEMSSLSRKILYFLDGDLTGIGSVNKDKRASHTQIINCFRENEDAIMHSYSMGKKYYLEFNRIISRTNISFIHFVLSTVNASDADKFISKLCTGLDVSGDSPIYQLRRVLVDNAISDKKLHRRSYFALIYKTWNLFRKGRTVKTKPHFDLKDKFPELV